jgi:hypothetical protein
MPCHDSVVTITSDLNFMVPSTPKEQFSVLMPNSTGEVATLFRRMWQTFSDFRMQEYDYDANGVKFGDQVSVDIARKGGDQIYKITAVVRLPGIYHEDYFKTPKLDADNETIDTCSESQCPHDGIEERNWVSWVNSIANVLFVKSELSVSGVNIDTDFGAFNEMQCNLTGYLDKTREQIGRYAKEVHRIADSRDDQVRYYPFKFYTCKDTWNSFPAFLTKQELNLTCKLANLSDCFTSSDGTLPWVKDGARPITASDINITFRVTAINLSVDEKRSMMQEVSVRPLQYLMREVQNNRGVTVSGHTPITRPNGNQVDRTSIPIDAPFRGPITGLYWYVSQNRHRVAKDWFNFAGINDTDPINKYEITNKTSTFVSEREASWARLLPTLYFHKQTPLNYYYCHLWSVNPNAYELSGFYNSTESDLKFHLTLQNGLDESVVMVWATLINVVQLQVNPITGNVEVSKLFLNNV